MIVNVSKYMIYETSTHTKTAGKQLNIDIHTSIQTRQYRRGQKKS